MSQLFIWITNLAYIEHVWGGAREQEGEWEAGNWGAKNWQYEAWKVLEWIVCCLHLRLLVLTLSSASDGTLLEDMCTSVLCHHSPRWISLTFGQRSIIFGWWPPIYVAPPSTNHGNHHSCPHHPSHPRWISLAFGQIFIISGWWPPIYVAPPSMNHSNHHSHPCHPSHPSFTSGQYLLLSEPSHLWATSSAH